MTLRARLRLLLPVVFFLAPALSLAKPPSQPEVRSAAALILDEASSEVLYARQADAPVPIASITKLMTALVVLEAGQPMSERIRITNADRSRGKGTFSRLPVGAVLTRAQLMKLALMASENRAAHALGRTYPGGMPAFLQAANAKARELGMTRTRFVDPTGLSSGNVASPSDLARLVIAASRDPTIRAYSTDLSLSVRVGKQMLAFHNTNSLVRNPAWDIALQKTGYISAAGRCLVMKARIDGRNVVIILLNSFGKHTRVADAKRVRQWMETQLRTVRS